MIWGASTRATVRVGEDAADCMEPLERHKDETNLSYAYRTLSYNILMLKIPPAAFIQEARVAERLGMSKGPVHQAITLLRDYSLVDVKARSATHVSLISLDAVSQGFFLRSTVEPAIVNDLVGTISDRDLDLLRANLEQQRAVLAETTNPFGFIQLDDDFHRIIYQADRKDLIWGSIKKVTAHFDRIRYMGLTLGYEQPSEKEHIHIYEMLESSRRPSGRTVERYLKSHLSHYKGYLGTMVKDHPEYFER